MNELRDYQKDIVEQVMSTSESVVVGLPTGGGKTVIAAELIRRAPTTVIFVVPRIDLILQASSTFGDVDVIWGAKTFITGKKCIVATKPSLMNRISRVPKGCVIIFDECHIGMETNKDIVDELQPLRVIGLTATPETMSGKSFLKLNAPSTGATGDVEAHRKNTGIYDKVLYPYSIPDLQKLKYLSPLVQHHYECEGIEAIKTNAFQEEVSGKKLLEFLNENMEVWTTLGKILQEVKDEPTIIFTPTIDVAERVADFCNKQFNFKVITGETRPEERQKLYEQLKNHEINGLVNAALLTYGFDCPAAKNAILFRRILSRPLYAQIVGRILRPFEDKTAHLYDIFDSNSSFVDAVQTDMFDIPVKWRYDGFDVKEDEEISETMRMRLEKIKSKGDAYFEQYLKDPIGTLFSTIEYLNDTFEEKLFEKEQLIAQYYEEANKQTQLLAEDKVEKANRKVAKLQDMLDDATTCNLTYYMRNIYNNKYDFVSILRNLNYDSTTATKDDMNNAIREFYNTIPDRYKVNVTNDDLDYMKGKLQWWLHSFKPRTK